MSKKNKLVRSKSIYDVVNQFNISPRSACLEVLTETKRLELMEKYGVSQKSIGETNDIQKIRETPELLKYARKAVQIILDEGYKYKISPFKNDSGTLALHLLKAKEENKNFTDTKFIKNNLDELSLDQCMEVIYGIAHEKAFIYLLFTKSGK